MCEETTGKQTVLYTFLIGDHIDLEWGWKKPSFEFPTPRRLQWHMGKDMSGEAFVQGKILSVSLSVTGIWYKENDAFKHKRE